MKTTDVQRHLIEDDKITILVLTNVATREEERVFLSALNNLCQEIGLTPYASILREYDKTEVL